MSLNYDMESEPQPRQHSDKRQRTEMVAVRLLPSELAVLEEAAAEEGLPTSTFMREQALKLAHRIVTLKRINELLDEARATRGDR